MKKSFARIFVTFVIVLFVNFMFSSSIFTHMHKGLDGRRVTHSHPYLPSSGHNHTTHSFDLVAAFNAAASAAQCVREETVKPLDNVCIRIDIGVCVGVISAHVLSVSLRAPPFSVA